MSIFIIGIAPAFFSLIGVSSINRSFFINPRFSFVVSWFSFNKIFYWVISFVKSFRISKSLFYNLSSLDLL